jgi:hypothetical protein
MRKTETSFFMRFNVISKNDSTFSTISGSVLPDSLTETAASSSNSWTWLWVIVCGVVAYFAYTWFYGQQPTSTPPISTPPTNMPYPPPPPPPQRIPGDQYVSGEGQYVAGGLESISAPTQHQPEPSSFTFGEDKVSYCLIGDEYDGTRKCTAMTTGDTCKSNQVYPTANTCVNPNLK